MSYKELSLISRKVRIKSIIRKYIHQLGHNDQVENMQCKTIHLEKNTTNKRGDQRG